MSAIAALDEDECYLAALLDDPSGIDLAEFCWVDEEQQDGCFRVWDFQWPWYHCDDIFQIDQCARSLGKSTGIQMRAFAFPFNYPGSEMLITAPELNHLRPLVDQVEARILSTRLARELLPNAKGVGISHQPQFQVRFSNGARIISRLPQRDGKGVKGCVESGVLILTRRGQVLIDDLQVGDEVLTHLGRWRPVTAKYQYTKVDGFRIAGGGHRGFLTSANHRMWGRRNRNPQRLRNLEPPDWVIVDDPELPERYYLGSPTRFPSEPIPIWATPELLWVAGRYVADGHLTWQTKRGSKTSARIMVTVQTRWAGEVELLFKQAGLRPAIRHHDGDAVMVEACNTELCRELLVDFGQHAANKYLPTWLLGAAQEYREAFLEGYLSGDGHYDESKRRWQLSTSSKQLAIGLRLLGQSLGFSAGYSWVDPNITHIKGRELRNPPARSHRVTLSESHRNVIVEGDVAWQKVRTVEAVTDIPVVYDLTVEDDHSYIADGLVSHNMHPLVLEADEMQDYPEAGWIELIETLKRGSKGSQWRCHGVSRGVRDRYYKQTQPDSGWTVHRYMAMHRPSWSDAERVEKMATYGGSRDNPDYKRNIYGLHGDAANPLFVLARLMACVNMDVDYNQDLYTVLRVSYELLSKGGVPIEQLLELPGSHLRGYASYWAGMDVGFTNHPSEILVFGLLPKGGKLRLLTRVHLERIDARDQMSAIAQLFRFYGPKLAAFAMDKTGNGLPIWQLLLREAVDQSVRDRIKGYNFSAKYAVGFEDRDLEGAELTSADPVIEKNIVEYSSDKLREYVDGSLLELPFDRELLGEWQGQSYTVVRTTTNPYGKRSYSQGKFHTLDAGRMMIAAHTLQGVDAALNRQPTQAPILDQFVAVG